MTGAASRRPDPECGRRGVPVAARPPGREVWLGFVVRDQASNREPNAGGSEVGVGELGAAPTVLGRGCLGGMGQSESLRTAGVAGWGGHGGECGEEGRGADDYLVPWSGF